VKFQVGSFISPLYNNIDIMNSDLYEPVEPLKKSDILTVIGGAPPLLESRLNINSYIKVVSSQGKVGWVSKNNFEEISGYPHEDAHKNP